jgi:hypothetical protein
MPRWGHRGSNSSVPLGVPGLAFTYFCFVRWVFQWLERAARIVSSDWKCYMIVDL